MSRPSPRSKAQKFDLITQSLAKFAHRLRFSVVAKRKGAEVDRDARVRLQQIMDLTRVLGFLDEQVLNRFVAFVKGECAIKMTKI